MSGGRLLTPLKDALPAIPKMQRKRRVPEIEAGGGEEEDSAIGGRLRCLALWSQCFRLLQSTSARSLTIFSDGGEVAGQKIDVYVGYSPGHDLIMALPCQVRFPPSAFEYFVLIF